MTITPSEVYREMQELSGIVVGDTVKVLRKAQDHEMGWGGVWKNAKNELLGKQLRVNSTHSTGGIGLILGCWEFYVPFFILERIEVVPQIGGKPLKKEDEYFVFCGLRLGPVEIRRLKDLLSDDSFRFSLEDDELRIQHMPSSTTCIVRGEENKKKLKDFLLEHFP